MAPILTSQARLAPPGAGIPAIERLVGGLIFRLGRWRGTRERFASQFAQERAAIGGLCAGKADATLSARVLIPRLRGLEDSSRNWSVFMTLDHLRIVNVQIADAIELLVKGQSPAGQVSTAAVKPSPAAGRDVVPAYESSCDALARVVAASPDLRTKVKYAHPWFGPLDAFGWQAMAAMHMGIHRVQIQRILRELPSEAP